MNVTLTAEEMLARMMEFVRPSFVQTAALCLREGAAGAREVLLVQTLQRRRWIVPKGWPIDGMTLAEAAAQEAWEEAGVRGRLNPEAIGAFTYTKIKKSGLPVQCRPHVFCIEVDTLADVYPEAGRRKRKWFDLRDAANAVVNRELSLLLRRL